MIMFSIQITRGGKVPPISDKPIGRRRWQPLLDECFALSRGDRWTTLTPRKNKQYQRAPTFGCVLKRDTNQVAFIEKMLIDHWNWSLPSFRTDPKRPFYTKWWTKQHNKITNWKWTNISTWHQSWEHTISSSENWVANTVWSQRDYAIVYIHGWL